MTESSKLGIMLDLETLDLGPRSIITQVGIIAFPLDDPETEMRRISEYLPVQPQFELKRTVSFSTVLWWMEQEDAPESASRRATATTWRNCSPLSAPSIASWRLDSQRRRGQHRVVGEGSAIRCGESRNAIRGLRLANAVALRQRDGPADSHATRRNQNRNRSTAKDSFLTWRSRTPSSRFATTSRRSSIFGVLADGRSGFCPQRSTKPH
jgi:hypothetical protein